MLWDNGSIEAALTLGWLNPRNPLIVALFLPVAGLAVNVPLQVLFLRLSKGQGFMRTVAIGFFAGGLFTLAAYPLLARHWCSVPPGNAGYAGLLLEWLILIAPAYAGLGYGYANFAGLGHSSIRIRLYDGLRRSPEGRLLVDIQREYDETVILRTRLDRLTEGGDLVQAGDLWKTGRQRFVVIGRIIFFVKWVVLRKQSEFEAPTAP